MDIATVNYLQALGTIALQISAIGLLILYIVRKRSFTGVVRLVQQWGMVLAFLLSFSAAGLTLFYSEVLGIEPCYLCWWQRIFLYPQVVLFGIALWKRDTVIALYSIVLSVLGLGVSIYHHALQTLPSGSLPCPATGVSCAQRFMFEFGYITYPLMAATLFAALILLMLFVRSRSENVV